MQSVPHPQTESALADLYQGIVAAQQRIAAVVRHTEVVYEPALCAALGVEVWLKCENLQHTGAFKFRGASNAALQLSAAERAAGVFTVSSGNHGAALAAIGQQLDIPITIGVSSSASTLKRANMEGYGANLVTIAPGMAAREAFVQEQQENAAAAVFIPPYNHPHIIAGQGTAALELLQHQPQLDSLLAPLGGGGLLSGTAIVAKQHGLDVFGVEPELAADGIASIATGLIQPAFPPLSICDGLLTSLGTETLPLLQHYVDKVVLVSDDEASAAQQLVFETTKMWIEPSSAVTIAALKRYHELFKGRRIGVIVSGGNAAQLANS